MKRKLLLSILLVPFMLIGCKGNNNSSDTPSSNESSSVIESIIVLKENKLEIKVGESCQLEPILAKPSMLVFYESKDPNIASVDNDGVVTGVSTGTTIIYAKCGKDKALAQITVKGSSLQYDLYISMPQDSYELKLGQDYVLPISTLVGTEEVPSTLTYEVKDNNILSVEEGIVKPLAVGTTGVVITATYNDLEAKKTISITVN